MSSLQLIGATDAARLLGVSRSGFDLKCQRGEVKAQGRIGKRGIRVFDRAEIERIAAEGREQ